MREVDRAREDVKVYSGLESDWEILGMMSRLELAKNKKECRTI